MYLYNVFPEGKKRIVTFSYDDGASNDKRLIELFNKYSVKGTFHLNSRRLFENKTPEGLSEYVKLYEGHEVSCHTYSHGFPSRMPMQSVVTETFEDRKILESIFRYPVIGMSYPSGSYNDDAISAMKACGIVYSRTTKSTNSFTLPDDFMKWHPTCHHNDALTLCDRFINSLDSKYANPLFYIWGHSHELREESDWSMMEEILKKLSNNEKIWYATNIEIYNYITALKHLQISADEKIIYNPTSLTLWLEKDQKDIIKIPAGETVYL